MEKHIYLYFIQAIDNGPIKIGISKDLEKKFLKIQKNSPIELKILHYATGNKFLKDYLLKKFKSYHSHNNWFLPNQEIIDFINEIKNQPSKLDGLNSFLKYKSGISCESNDISLEEIINHKAYQLKTKALEMGLPDPFPNQKIDIVPEWVSKQIENYQDRTIIVKKIKKRGVNNV